MSGSSKILVEQPWSILYLAHLSVCTSCHISIWTNSNMRFDNSPTTIGKSSGSEGDKLFAMSIGRGSVCDCRLPHSDENFNILPIRKWLFWSLLYHFKRLAMLMITIWIDPNNYYKHYCEWSLDWINLYMQHPWSGRYFKDKFFFK